MRTDREGRMELRAEGKTILRQLQKTDFEKRTAAYGDYLIFEANVLDSVYEQQLKAQGCDFLDRILCFEIPLKEQLHSKRAVPVAEVTLQSDRIMDEKVLQLAMQAYTSDRRFHLDPVFNQTQADKVIAGYIDYYRKKDCRVYKAVCKEELLGVVVVCEDMDPEGRCFENVLGATLPGIKGKMTAVPLYAFMLEEERKAGFKKYFGKVSSSNDSSINLHFQLGGRVTRIFDEFIYRKQPGGSG